MLLLELNLLVKLMAINSFVQDLLVECCRSTKVLAKTLLPERFNAPFSTYLHDQIFDIIDSDAPRVAIAAPRGSGKTSISIAKAAQGILFNMRHFISWVSTSHDVATMQTENLKRELMTGSHIKKLFGSVKTRGASELDESFSKKSWVGFDRTLVLPRGCGQQVRGILFGAARPDLIIVDDLEHPEEIKSDELRMARKNWFWADLMKCTSRFDNNWKVIYIDTLKHEDSLLQDLLDSKDWESVRLEICDDNLEPRAPEIMTKEEIMREYNSHDELGMLDVFYREFRNLPIATKNSAFQQKYFKYFENTDIEGKQIENVVLVDPAKTTNMSSAQSAIVGVGIDTNGNALYVRDIDANRFHPDELYAHALDMCVRLNARVLAVEVTSLNEFITQPFKNEISRRGMFGIEFVELKARGGTQALSKEQRVRALVPYYRQGLVYHSKACCAGLEAQLLAFPRSKLWDIMDAFAYIVELLDVGERYFEHPEDGSLEDELFDFDLNDERELKRLNYEPPLTGWRYA